MGRPAASGRYPSRSSRLIVSAPLRVTLYGNPHCGLCAEAAVMLGRIGRRIALQVSVVDIDSSPELQARYLVEIPVVVANGLEVARAPIREAALEAALAEVAHRAG